MDNKIIDKTEIENKSKKVGIVASLEMEPSDKSSPLHETIPTFLLLFSISVLSIILLSIILKTPYCDGYFLVIYLSSSKLATSFAIVSEIVCTSALPPSPISIKPCGFLSGLAAANFKII